MKLRDQARGCPAVTDAQHDELREASGLYVLGALTQDERVRLEAHLQTCDACMADVRSLRGAVDSLAFAVPQIDPPTGWCPCPGVAGKTERPAATGPFRSSEQGADWQVENAPTPRGPAFWAGWLTAAALLLIAAGAGVYAANLRNQLTDVELRLVDAVMKLQLSEERVANASAESNAIRANLALLTAPDTVEMSLRGAAPAPNAAGRAFISRSRGLLFAASKLPPLPQDRTYQLWFLTRGAPVSAGIVRPDPQGNVTAAFDPPDNAPAATGFAVSIEPEGGVPAPTGAIYLATQ